MPKEERLKQFRNDSVDEVDTTDLENWALKARRPRKRNEIDSVHSEGIDQSAEGSLEWLWANEYI